MGDSRPALWPSFSSPHGAPCRPRPRVGPSCERPKKVERRQLLAFGGEQRPWRAQGDDPAQGWHRQLVQERRGHRVPDPGAAARDALHAAHQPPNRPGRPNPRWRPACDRGVTTAPLLHQPTLDPARHVSRSAGILDCLRPVMTTGGTPLPAAPSFPPPPRHECRIHLRPEHAERRDGAPAGDHGVIPRNPQRAEASRARRLPES
jgi:hypothetical protein